jgi:CHAD domain-containing protein
MRTTGTTTERILSIYVELVRKSQRAIEKRAPGGTAVHNIRKSLKRARGALRVLRPGIGEIAYRSANRALRDSGRPLSRVRDALILERLHRRLRDEHTAARKYELTARTRRSIGMRLEGEIERASHWRLKNTHTKDLRAATDKIYRQGAKAMTRARKKGTAEALHEWRKQAKYLRYALEVIDGPHGKIKRLKKLADYLGDDHDLWVLRERIRKERRTGVANLLLTIDERRDKLQHHAFAIGKHVYGRAW